MEKVIIKWEKKQAKLSIKKMHKNLMILRKVTKNFHCRATVTFRKSGERVGEKERHIERESTCLFRTPSSWKPPRSSMGRGKMMVLFFSAEME